MLHDLSRPDRYLRPVRWADDASIKSGVIVPSVRGHSCRRGLNLAGREDLG